MSVNVFAQDDVIEKAIEIRKDNDVTRARALLSAFRDTVFGPSKATPHSISPLDALDDNVVLGALTKEVPTTVIIACYLDYLAAWYDTPVGVISQLSTLESVALVTPIEAMTEKVLTSAQESRGRKEIAGYISQYAGLHNKKSPIYTGFAPLDDESGSYINLGFNYLWKVTAEGASQIDRNEGPIFNRTPYANALVAGADDVKYTDDEAREKFLSLSAFTDDGATAVWGWAMSFAAYPAAAHPALFFEAPKGTGKTTASNSLTRLYSDEDESLGIDDIREHGITNAARGIPIITLDNIDGIRSSESDLLSRAITGKKSRKRKNYADLDSIIERMRLGIIFTTTATSSLKSDLQDRMLVIPMEKKKYRDEDVIVRELNKVLPYARRALLNDASKLLAAVESGEMVDPEEGYGQRMRPTSRCIAWMDKKRGTDATETLKSTKAKLAEDAVPSWVESIVANGKGFSHLTSVKMKREIVRILREAGCEGDAKHVDIFTKKKLTEQVMDHFAGRSDCELTTRNGGGTVQYSLSILPEGEGVISTDDSTFTTIDM